MEPRLRASPEQFSAMIEFMERHGDMSRPQKGPQGRLNADRLWQEMADCINAVGTGVIRTPDKWKKVWADWKTKTKKKMSAIRQSELRTGGGRSTRPSLTPLEERVLAVMGRTAVEGLPGIDEQGLNRLSQLSDRPISQRIQNQFNFEVPLANIAPPLQSPPLLSPQYDEPSWPWLSPPTRPSPTRPPAQHPHLPSHPPPQHLSLPPYTPPQQPPLPPRPPQQHPSLPPPPPPPPQHPSLPPSSPPQHPPPLQNAARSVRRHATASPLFSASFTPQVESVRMGRRNRTQTPFNRAVSEFVAVEQRRLQMEQTRDRRLYELEVERLRLESQRIEVAREHNTLLRQLGAIAQSLVNSLNQQQTPPTPSLASTVILPDSE